MPSMPGVQRGFTLIEILIVLMLTAIALLALGTFSLSVMDSGTVSRERLTAVHLAEQVIEEWQHSSNDYFPSIASDCTMSAGSAVVSTSTSVTCTPAVGVKAHFTIVASVAGAQAPLPDGAGNVSFAALSGTATYPNTPVVKLVTINWTHKGESKSIYLTHLTR